MPTFITKVNNHTPEKYVQQYIDRWTFENFQPIESLTDVQIEGMGNSLEVFLQTEIGTPNGYTIVVKLINVQTGTEVDDLEVVSRIVSDIGFEIIITVI